VEQPSLWKRSLEVEATIGYVDECIGAPDPRCFGARDNVVLPKPPPASRNRCGPIVRIKPPNGARQPPRAHCLN